MVSIILEILNIIKIIILSMFGLAKLGAILTVVVGISYHVIKLVRECINKY